MAFADPTPAVEADEGTGWRRLLAFGAPKQRPRVPLVNRGGARPADYFRVDKKTATADTRLDEACFDALDRIGTAVVSRRGRLFGDNALLTELAVTLVCNDYGSEVIGDAIVAYVQEAVLRESYRPLPAQEKPVVMNVKGASASRQKHDAAAAENPGAESLISLGKSCADQSRYLAKVSSGL